MESIVARPKLARSARPWAYLSPDLLLDVSSRLHDASDFVRFHAVCKPWRDAAPSLLSPAASRPAFLPWLLAVNKGRVAHSTLDFRCVTSSSDAPSDGRSYGILAEPLGAQSTDGGGGDRNWVACADGTDAWLFVATPEPRLVKLITGAVILLPRFPDNNKIKVPMEKARGIVYGDGTVLLYSFLYRKTPAFTAAALRPGDAAWTVMKRNLELPAALQSSVVYHDGKILLCMGTCFWSVLTGGGIGGSAFLQSRWDASEYRKYSYECNYVMESRGDLLWTSILLERDWRHHGYAHDDLSSILSVTVHELKEGAGGVKRWVARDGCSLADRILFLGSPASFTVDAAQLGIVGGCAYFVFRGNTFRYNLFIDEAEVVRQLPRRWGTDGACVWLLPQPAIAPIHEIRERLEARSKQEAVKMVNW